MVLTLWNVRSKFSENPDVIKAYVELSSFCTFKIHHRGMFTKYPGRRYVGGSIDYVDYVDMDVFSVHELDDMMKEIGYINGEPIYYHFLIPDIEIDYGLLPLGNDSDVLLLSKHVANHKEIMVYPEHGTTRLHTYFMSPNKVVLEEINEPISSELNQKKFTSTEVGSCSRKLDLNENYDFSRSVVPFGHFDRDVLKDVGVQPASEELNKAQDVGPSEDFDPFFYMDHNDYQQMGDDDYQQMGDNEETGDAISDETSTNGSISDNSDFLVNEINIVEDVEVNMKDFHSGVYSFPNLDNHQSFNAPDVTIDEDLEVIDTQLFESAGVEEDERKKLMRRLNKPTMCSSGVVHETAFHLGQIFKSSSEAKDYIKMHSIRTRRNIYFAKHDKQRIRAKCRGVVLEMTGRAHTDILLNNLCEVFNSKLLDARDKPIITCLEYIREYLMKRICIVQNVIDKSKGPLTPTTIKLLDGVKKAASQYTCIFNGAEKTQVTGTMGEQFVVNWRDRNCSCMNWEITGIPCSHLVSAIWDKVEHGEKNVPPLEEWVHPCYRLSTWNEMYKYKVQPINGRSVSPKSDCPKTLTPPKHTKQAGRPKKKRKRAQTEEPNNEGKSLTRKFLTVTCSKCKNKGHNSRSCKGQGGQNEVRNVVAGGRKLSKAKKQGDRKNEKTKLKDKSKMKEKV
ncbi:unnamed protein product [Lactuca saligna]|uniref:SWIM-type domain-containing protein n=1 Tax=Lactuca saligna TaxID=75948 RepID=A0AA36ECC4_LACSI|nr:unnamed protein product [Lactuca saligna]